MKNLLISGIISLFAYIGCGFTNDFQVRDVPASIVSSYYNKNYKNSLTAKTFYKMSAEELQGKDAASYIEEILKKNKTVLLPNTTITINKGGITIPSNSTLYFDKNTLFKYSGPAIGRLSDVVKIYNANNVKIYNAKVQGSKNIKQQTGEWSAGICILNSSNILIENAYVYETWGDGIFIGSEDGKHSENILINGGWIDNARRNGVSITSGKNVSIKKILISNTNGTSPETGLHIEPSLYEEILNNIKIDNVYSFNNANGGLAFNLQAFSQKDKPSKYVDITIDHFKSNLSKYSVGFSINNTSDKNNPYGKITIKNSVLEKPEAGYIWKNEDKYKNISISYENITNK